jgi:uncharacterized protein YbbC (DUF1343 family)
MNTGLDVLLSQRQDLVADRAVGLVANYASVTRDNMSAVDAVRALGPRSLVVFGPEHGYWGDVQYMEASAATHYRDIPLRNLYEGKSGHALFPEPRDLKALDVLLIDLQDVGARYYTYYATMANCMEVAAVTGTPVVVLDRPNPINGLAVEGPSLRAPFIAFVGQYPIPIRHGMTIGELAKLLNQTIGCELEVIAMEGWRRGMWWSETGLPWVHPSPNIPTPDTTVVYPGTCLFEGTNLSEGRGTTRPFEIFGAPWLDAFALADALNGRALPGVQFEPLRYVPAFSKHSETLCNGVRVIVTDREALEPVRLGIWCIAVARELDPERFDWNRETYEWANCSAIDALLGGIEFRALVDTGGDLAEWLESWRANETRFRRERAKHLIESYTDPRANIVRGDVPVSIDAPRAEA